MAVHTKVLAELLDSNSDMFSMEKKIKLACRLNRTMYKYNEVLVVFAYLSPWPYCGFMSRAAKSMAIST